MLCKRMEAANGHPIPYANTERRPGEAAISVADPSKAARRLGGRTPRNLERFCREGSA